jgi:tRNA modification GTPase
VAVIAGPPNAGKSSLFNALVGRSRAIVTEIPGTTRDALEAVIDSGKFPLRLVDTAGLREASDPIERLGIEVSERYLASAHVVIACAEDAAGLSDTVTTIEKLSNAPIVRVLTKSDLVSYRNEMSPAGLVCVSAETGTGLQQLLDAINLLLASSHGEIVADLPMLTSARHRQALTMALNELGQFEQAWGEQKLPAPVASVHLRTAVYVLEELIGAVDVEDVFDRVFRTFCVGK